jgi:hypothetical protein
MKKKFIFIGLCILLIIMPSFSCISQINEKPIWAIGSISGRWGIREFDLITNIFDGANGNGMIEHEIGDIQGYYGKIFGKVYIFQGFFYPNYNKSRVTNITGLCYGNIIGGRIGNISIDDNLYDIELREANYCGIGDFNETFFNWRILLKTGPTFYIKGNFLKI